MFFPEGQIRVHLYGQPTDMRKPFRNSTQRHAPQAAILFDKFHVLRHLNDALDAVRKQEYARLDGEPRKFIKGQKYALLSNPENLKGDARSNLKQLLRVNKRLNTAYLLISATADGYRTAAAARQSAFEVGSKQCQDMDKRFMFVSETSERTRMGIDTTINVIFRCLSETDPAYQRPDVRAAPAIVIEDGRK